MASTNVEEMETYQIQLDSKGFETTSQFTLQADDVAGVISSAVVPFESIESITNGINLGLSSYIDVRLALHLFRNVYARRNANIYCSNFTALRIERNPSRMANAAISRVARKSSNPRILRL